VHLLWLPHDRASQTFPARSDLETLPWASMTVVCDLSKLHITEPDSVKESMMTMLRAAVFIDPQFGHWLEGNLSALSDVDIELHKKAVMKTANTLFTVKRRRSDEPDIPMAFTGTAALRHTSPASELIPAWKVQARQLMLDIRYAVASDAIEMSSVQRIERIMTSLGLIEAANDADLLDVQDPEADIDSEPFLIINDLGTATFTRHFGSAAWRRASNPNH